MARARTLPVRQADHLKLLPTRSRRIALVVILVLFVVAPFYVQFSWLELLTRCGIAAIGAVGLMLLTGYGGQVSLGQAFFLGVGAYAAGWAGVQHGWPLLVWLPIAAIIGGLIGAVIGPFALRLRGNYLAIVTIGLLFVGEHIFVNWDSLTGGTSGTSTDAPVSVGPINFAKLELPGYTMNRTQGLFLLVWIVAGLAILVARNVARSRPGRALQAVRDRDVAAEVIGVDVARYKVGAFALSSAFAAVAGGLFGVVQLSVTPAGFSGVAGLALSITYVAMIIVGGVGTISGAVIGAILVAGLPELIRQMGQTVNFPLITGDAGGSAGVLSVFAFNQVLFGLAIILVLLLEPSGVMGLWRRVRGWFRSWPFGG